MTWRQWGGNFELQTQWHWRDTFISRALHCGTQFLFDIVKIPQSFFTYLERFIKVHQWTNLNRKLCDRRQSILQLKVGAIRFYLDVTSLFSFFRELGTFSQRILKFKNFEKLSTFLFSPITTCSKIISFWFDKFPEGWKALANISFPFLFFFIHN